MGELNTIDEHLNEALANIAAAQSATDVDEIKTSTASAMADASAIAELADGLPAHATAAAEVDVEDGNLAEGAAGVIASAANISAWVTAAKATADNDVASQTSTAVANIFVDKIFNELSAAKNGWDANTDGTISPSTGEGGSDQARASAQQMGTLVLEAKDLPGSETATVGVGGSSGGSVLGLGLPSVGEKLIINLLMMGAVLGIFITGVGSLILVRNRT